MKFKKIVSTPVILVLILYVISHLPGLLELPVFADEAIYIRWAQLIIDDPVRYFFFPMNDGKTPLFFWILAPFQYVFSNQLFAARFVSVIIGFFQVLVVMKITKLFSKSEKVVALAGLFTTLLPFWYFHHRMVLTDGLMTLFVSLTYYQLIKLFSSIKPLGAKKLNFKLLLKTITQKKYLIQTFLTAIWFSLALYSKIPAILFLPGLALTIFFTTGKQLKDYVLATTLGLVAFSFSIALFLLLAFSPSFPQLFGRGSDFLFPVTEVINGRWKETMPSVPVYIGYFISYMTPTFLLFSLIGLFSKRYKKPIHIFFWSGVLFLLPIAVMGKVVYPRYLFPAVLPFTLSSVLGVVSVYQKFAAEQKKFWIRAIGTSVVVVLVANSIATASIFVLHSINNHQEIPFVSSDVAQYLTKWSSGHGISETVELIKKEAETNSVAVATEGSFGTLPDGLVLYFHKENVDNIYIDGIGVPVDDIPEEFAQRAQNFEKKWVVVNADRMKISLPEEYLVAEFCRPYTAPCLEVWDITSEFDRLTNLN